MPKAYRYSIYPNTAQKKLLTQHFGCVRWVYNWALAKSKKYYEKKQKHLKRRALQDELVALKKKPEYAWLKEVNRQSLLASLLHLHVAYKNFFSKHAKFPKCKKKNNKQAFQSPQHVQVDEKEHILHLPKIKT